MTTSTQASLTAPQSPLVAQELLRQQYLAAMGVTSWLPRQPLPSAAPSPQWQWLDPASGGDTATRTAAQAGRVTPAQGVSGVAQARSALAGLMSTQPGSQAKPQVEPQSESQAPTAVVPSGTLVAKPAAVDHLPTAVTVQSPPSTVGKELDQSKTKTNSVATVTAALTRQLSASPDEVPRFRLALLAYRHCLVVTELPLRHAQPWSDAHQQLLTAIVAAIGLTEPEQGPLNYREFHWPLDPAAVFDQSDVVARHTLEVELAEVRLPEQRALLLMGDSAARYLLPPDQPTSDQSALNQSLQQGVLLGDDQQRVLCCHGLNEVLRLPGLKAELWRQLQPLRQFASTLTLLASTTPADQPETAQD
ncbi:MAG: hypothetical protein V7707_04615 [Motiliproteus sp.]